MSKNDPQRKLRLPADLDDRLRKSAEISRRTLNSEIIVLLERALPKSEQAETAPTVSA